MRAKRNRCRPLRLCFIFGLLAIDVTGDSADTNLVQTFPASHGEEKTDAPRATAKFRPAKIADTVQGSTSSRIASLAKWVDSFFDDPDYAEEEASARASLSQSVTFYREPDPAYRTRVRASVALPNLSSRLRLTFEGNDALYAEDYAEDVEPDLQESTKESIDDPSLRLQYIFLQYYEADLRMSGGIRLDDSSVYVGPRAQLRAGIGSRWEAKLTQRIYWYTTDNLKSKTELRFDRILGEHNLFRQTFRTDWSEERHQSEGFRHTVSSSITQPLKKTAAFRYRWSSVYFTRPDPGWTSTAVSVGYRQSLWRDWIILEVAPFVRWEQQFDWEPEPGITLSLSAIFEEKG